VGGPGLPYCITPEHLELSRLGLVRSKVLLKQIGLFNKVRRWDGGFFKFLVNGFIFLIILFTIAFLSDLPDFGLGKNYVAVKVIVLRGSSQYVVVAAGPIIKRSYFYFTLSNCP
jgi:hypothetical protein